MGAIYQGFKPNLVQIHTKIIICRSILTYGSRAWTVGERDERRIRDSGNETYEENGRLCSFGL
jgi:hypothetical protein